MNIIAKFKLNITILSLLSLLSTTAGVFAQEAEQAPVAEPVAGPSAVDGNGRLPEHVVLEEEELREVVAEFNGATPAEKHEALVDVGVILNTPLDKPLPAKYNSWYDPANRRKAMARFTFLATGIAVSALGGSSKAIAEGKFTAGMGFNIVLKSLTWGIGTYYFQRANTTYTDFITSTKWTNTMLRGPRNLQLRSPVLTSVRTMSYNTLALMEGAARSALVEFIYVGAVLAIQETARVTAGQFVGASPDYLISASDLAIISTNDMAMSFGLYLSEAKVEGGKAFITQAPIDNIVTRQSENALNAARTPEEELKIERTKDTILMSVGIASTTAVAVETFIFGQDKPHMYMDYVTSFFSQALDYAKPIMEQAGNAGQYTSYVLEQSGTHFFQPVADNMGPAAEFLTALAVINTLYFGAQTGYKFFMNKFFPGDQRNDLPDGAVPFGATAEATSCGWSFLKPWAFRR